jgi:hypothetical protein
VQQKKDVKKNTKSIFFFLRDPFCFKSQNLAQKIVKVEEEKEERRDIQGDLDLDNVRW